MTFFGTNNVDWETRIDFDTMREKKQERARSMAEKYNLGSLLTFNGNNTRYLAQNSGNLRNRRSSGLRYCLFPSTDELPVLFEHGMVYPYTKANCPWLKVRSTPGTGGSGGGSGAGFFPDDAYDRIIEKFAAQIKEELVEYGLHKEVVGIDVQNERFIGALEDEGLELSTEGGRALIEARTIKTKEEVECLRQACAIVEAGFETSANTIAPGVTENEVRAAFLHKVWERGGSGRTADITSGNRTWVNHVNASDRMIRSGDGVIHHACGQEFNGYKTCYYRTFSCGQPSSELVDAYEQCRQYLYDSIELLRPGNTTEDIVSCWPKAEEVGYRNEEEAFFVQWGHGVGLSLAEPPSMTHLWSNEHPEEFKEGMTVAVETWVPTDTTSMEKKIEKVRNGEYAGESARIEEMVHITKNGPELLSKWPVDEITVC